MKSKYDLIPEEQETLQQSKDPSFIRTAKGTTRTTDEATEKCLRFGNGCASSIIERITRGTFPGEVVRGKRLLV